MERLQVLLRCALDRHEPNRGAAHGFADCLSVVAVVLVALHLGRHEVRTHEEHLMTEFGNLARPVVASRRRLPFRPGAAAAWSRTAATVCGAHAWAAHDLERS